jgi:hypothetical protein
MPIEISIEFFIMYDHKNLKIMFQILIYFKNIIIIINLISNLIIFYFYFITLIIL